MASDFTCELVKKHEAWRTRMYKDSKGIPTIGVGFNLEAPGAQAQIEYVGANYSYVMSGVEELSNDQVQILFNRSLANAEAQAYLALTSAKYTQLLPTAQSVVIDMVYNMGLTTFRQFKNFIGALQQFDYTSAAAAMKDSKWFTEVGTRGTEDYNLILACAVSSTAPQPA